MTRDEMIATLRALHAELADADSVDASTREAFAKVAADIERLTDPEHPSTAAEAEASHEGLSGLILDFETDHPQLAHTLGKLADGLANLGI